MHWVLLASLVAAVLVVLGGLAGAVWMRRRQLRATLGTFECDLRREDGTRWIPGVCRYSDRGLEFLKLWSVSPLPMLVLDRTGLEILSKREPERGELRTVDHDGIVVELATGGGNVVLGLAYDAYTGLSAWLEAGPVAGVGTWRQ